MSHFGELRKRLQEQFPIRRRLVVRVAKCCDHGSTSINAAETRITITIADDEAEDVQLAALAHEWAHAMEFDKYGAHSPLWGKFYSQTHGLYVKELMEGGE